MSRRPVHPVLSTLRLTRVNDPADGGCWIYFGATRNGGYAQVGHRGRKLTAHRVVYEALVAPIPDGLTLDHLCRNPSCVNPDHLEPVTVAENIRRAAQRITHCPRGHAHEPRNNIRSEARRGRRGCLACQREKDQERHEAIRAAAASLGLTYKEYRERYGQSLRVARALLEAGAA